MEAGDGSSALSEHLGILRRLCLPALLPPDLSGAGVSPSEGDLGERVNSELDHSHPRDACPVSFPLVDSSLGWGGVEVVHLAPPVQLETHSLLLGKRIERMGSGQEGAESLCLLLLTARASH